MATTTCIETLTRFMSGDATLTELEDAVAARLSDLRETLEVTEEQRTLSTIELMMEELREDMRDLLDVYTAVFHALGTFDVAPGVEPVGDSLETVSLPEYAQSHATEGATMQGTTELISTAA